MILKALTLGTLIIEGISLLITFLKKVFQKLFDWTGHNLSWLSWKSATKATFISIQITLATALIGFHIAMMTFIITLILFVYNSVNDLLNYVASGSQGNETVRLAIDVLTSMAFFDAFSAVFSLFAPIFISALVFMTVKYSLRSLDILSEYAFRVGVLAQQ